MTVIDVRIDAARIKREIRKHLRSLGFTRDEHGELVPPQLEKATYRALHLPQRQERIDSERRFVDRAWPTLGQYFAEGREVDVERIRIRLELIRHSTWQSDLFRLACLLWSVPVSRGFGRRMRYLVWDDSNGKLVGIFALGDPVFNLRARDTEIGWTGRDRHSRLVSILDAYVLGAVPPYGHLLGGKLIASLIRSKEVVSAFRERYRESRGIISGRRKSAELIAVTTTSALGRSSLYNRLALGNKKYFRSIGYTTGYGHFHVPDRLFSLMRRFLAARRDRYASNHWYGQGPNWRMRTIRRTFALLGLKPSLLKHGLRREVFICELADNAGRVLRGEAKRPRYRSLLSVDDIASLALARWVKPRSGRDSTYLTVTRHSIWCRITGADDSMREKATTVRRCSAQST